MFKKMQITFEFLKCVDPGLMLIVADNGSYLFGKSRYGYDYWKD